MLQFVLPLVIAASAPMPYKAGGTVMAQHGQWTIVLKEEVMAGKPGCLLVSSTPGATFLGLSTGPGEAEFQIRLDGEIDPGLKDLVLKSKTGSRFKVIDGRVELPSRVTKSAFLERMIAQDAFVVIDPATDAEVGEFSGAGLTRALVDWVGCRSDRLEHS